MAEPSANSLYTCQNWMAVPHKQLHDDINNGGGVAAGNQVVDLYKGIAQTFTDTHNDLTTGLKNMGIAWEGSAADEANAAIGALAKWSDAAHNDSTTNQKSAQHQVDTYSKAKSDMPAPVEVTSPEDNGFSKGVKNFFGIKTDHQEQEEKSNEAHIKAAQVMSTYATTSGNNVRNIGDYQAPPQVAVAVTPPPGYVGTSQRNVGSSSRTAPNTTGGSGGGSTGGSNNAGSTGGPISQAPTGHGGNTNIGQQGVGVTPPVAQPQPHPTPAPAPHGGGTPIVGTAPITGGGSTGGARPGVVRPGAGGAGSAGGGSAAARAGAGAGGALRGGAGGVGGLGGAAGEGAAGARGGAAGGAGAAGGRGGAAAGKAGQPGQSIMQRANGHGDGEDDAEHNRKYEIDGSDIFDDDRMVPPAVIGE
ncbi:PPE domain-containing protein [Pseudonocardiaceae bacterium YIM PH 21723]|nr:PPE domain-containing protein [Pseudonocardiaceae bacterium YIM PH 21723]